MRTERPPAAGQGPPAPGAAGREGIGAQEESPAVSRRAARGLLLGAVLGLMLWVGIILVLRRLLGG